MVGGRVTSFANKASQCRLQKNVVGRPINGKTGIIKIFVNENAFGTRLEMGLELKSDGCRISDYFEYFLQIWCGLAVVQIGIRLRSWTVHAG